MQQIFAKHAEKGTKPPLHRLQQITECLIDGLVEDHESVRAVSTIPVRTELIPSQSIVTCVKTIYVLTSTDPSILSTAKATILLPFLKSATTVRLFGYARVVLTGAGRGTSHLRVSPQNLPLGGRCDAQVDGKVLQGPPDRAHPDDQQTASRQRCSSASSLCRADAPQTLQEVVACFCAVVRGQTHDFVRLITIFKACICAYTAPANAS